MLPGNKNDNNDRAALLQFINESRNSGFTTIPTSNNQTVLIGPLLMSNTQAGSFARRQPGQQQQIQKPNKMTKQTQQQQQQQQQQRQPFYQVVNGMPPKSPIMTSSVGIEEKVTQLPSVVESLETKVTNFKEKFQTFSATNKAAVLVFGASHGVKMAEGDCVTYRDLDVPGSSEHGEFDKDAGVFEVKTAGKYQFHFYGIGNNASTRVYLDVNEENRAECSYHNASANSYIPLSMNCSLTLDSGDMVSVIVHKGSLYESGAGCTQFSALFLSGTY